MIARFFVDTNILLYAGSGAREDAGKRAVATEIVKRTDIGFSAQVLQEYYEVAYRKKRLGIRHMEAMHALRQLSKRPVLAVSSEFVLAGAELSERFGISYWDAAIIAAAREMQCEIIYSEDLSAGQVYDGVKVVNPFAGAAV